MTRVALLLLSLACLPAAGTPCHAQAEADTSHASRPLGPAELLGPMFRGGSLYGGPQVESTKPSLDIAERKPSKATGVFGVVAGTLLIPMGLLVSVSSEFAQCDDDATFSYGPCSSSGHNSFGHAAGIGLSLTGVVAIIAGVVSLAK